MTTLPTRVLQRVWRKGLWDTAAWGKHHAYERWREWWLGIATMTAAYPYGNDESELRQPYEPLNYQSLDAACRAIRRHCQLGSFLDFGCGRGRIMAAASTLPFRRVIGVELQSDLCESARENMSTCRRKRAGAWEVVQADAAHYVVPDDVNVVFMFNPFNGQILERVIEQLRSSLIRRQRTMWIAYMTLKSNPRIVEDCGWLNLKTELPVGLWSGMRFGLYESVLKDLVHV